MLARARAHKRDHAIVTPTTPPFPRAPRHAHTRDSVCVGCVVDGECIQNPTKNPLKRSFARARDKGVHSRIPNITLTRQAASVPQSGASLFSVGGGGTPEFG